METQKTLDEFFQGLELKPSEVDPCLYIMKRQKKVNISKVEDAVSAEYDYLYVLVYVDDLLLVSTSVELRQEVRQKLKKRFQMSQKVDNEPEELLGAVSVN